MVRIAVVEHGTECPNETVVQLISGTVAERLFGDAVRERLNLSPTLWRLYRLVRNAPFHSIPAEQVFVAFGVRPAEAHLHRGWLRVCASRISTRLAAAKIKLTMEVKHIIDGQLTVRLVP
jgi:hypothetical protein